MQRRTILPILVASAALFLAAGWTGVSDPPVTQDKSRAMVESFEAGCRVCHDAGIPDRHHALYDLPIIEESMAPYPDADGDGLPDLTYGCLNCHDANLTVVRNCVACHTSPVGTIPEGAGPTENPLTVTRTVGGDLTLSWDGSCGVTDTDYAIYEGALGNFTSHAPIGCSTAGATSATFAPPAGGAYYLVVPRNHWSEGSYGVDGDGAQRPPSAAACLSQSIGCPWP